MTRKLFTAALFQSSAAMLSALAETAETAQAKFGLDVFSILHDNLPTITEDGQTYSSLNPDEAGMPVLDERAASGIGSLAIVPVYGEQEVAIPGEDPALMPVAFYVLTLPKVSEVLGNEKLSDYRAKLIEKDLLAKARAIASRHQKDPAAAPMIRDRISALIAVAGRNTNASAEKAYTALFPTLQLALLGNIAKKAEALKAAGDHQKARLLVNIFSKARLNRDTIKSCLSSSEAARIEFPALPQSSWANLLNFAVAYCPRHLAKKRVTDAEGNPVKDAEGKLVYTREPMPLNPSIFQQWLATRDETAAGGPSLDIDLSDMGFAAPDASAA